MIFPKLLVLFSSLFLVFAILFSSVLSVSAGSSFTGGDTEPGTSVDVPFDDQKEIEKAAEYIRGQMIQRNTGINGVITTDKTPSVNVISMISEKIYEYIDDPKAGDYLRLHVDNMEITYLPSIRGGKYVTSYTVTNRYNTTKQQEDTVDRMVHSFVSGLSGLNDYRKISKIYDYIVDNVEYDYEENSIGIIRYTAYSALVNKKAVCQGFSALFYRLTKEAGIHSRIITGVSNNKHAWNIVKIGDLYYNIDTTWASSSKEKEKHFLKGNLTFTNHYPDIEFKSSDFKSAFPISDYDYTDESDVTVVDRGNLTDTVTYKVNTIESDDGIPRYSLSICGQGAMPDYDENAPKKWERYKQYITSVTVNDGITYVGDNTFSHMDSLEKVSVAGTVREFGDYVFFESKKINSLLIPLNIKMGLCDFGAKYGDVYWEFIPNERKLRIFGEGEMGVPLANGSYRTEEVPWGNFRQNVKTLQIDEGVETISVFAFYSFTELESAVLPNSLRSIGERSFKGASKLEEIKIPEGVETIKADAFTDCDQLKSVTLPSTVTQIDSRAFGYKSDNTKVEGLVINAPKDSTAEKYAAENKIEINEIKEEEKIYTIKDAKTGVSVQIKDPNARLLTGSPSKAVQTLIKKSIGEGKRVVSSFSVKIESNVQSTADPGQIQLRFKIPEGNDIKDLEIYKLEGENARKVESSIDGDEILVSGDINGVYAIVSKESTDPLNKGCHSG